MAELLDIVDENDNVIGQKERDACLKEKLLHRAIHVFVFNSKGDLLLQKRSSQKKTYPGLWTSSCSGHVSSKQTYEEAAVRELKEELGINVASLEEVEKFKDLNPIDMEIAKLFKVFHEGPFDFSKDEVNEVKFVPLGKLKEDMKKSPEKYTPDFALALSIFEANKTK